jgi:hypothetical protein
MEQPQQWQRQGWDNCVSLQTVAAHPDAHKGGTAKKKFGDNCVSSRIRAAHPDVQKGGTTDSLACLLNQSARIENATRVEPSIPSEVATGKDQHLQPTMTSSKRGCHRIPCRSSAVPSWLCLTLLHALHHAPCTATMHLQRLQTQARLQCQGDVVAKMTWSSCLVGRIHKQVR